MKYFNEKSIKLTHVDYRFLNDVQDQCDRDDSIHSMVHRIGISLTSECKRNIFKSSIL